MSPPLTERQSLETALAELTKDLVCYRAELDAMPLDAKARRQMKTWQIQRAQRRMADLQARLAPMPAAFD